MDVHHTIHGGKSLGFSPTPLTSPSGSVQSPMPSVKTTNWPLGPWTPSWGRLEILEMMTSYDFHRVHSTFQQSLLQNVTDVYSGRLLNAGVCILYSLYIYIYIYTYIYIYIYIYTYIYTYIYIYTSFKCIW